MLARTIDHGAPTRLRLTEGDLAAGMTLLATDPTLDSGRHRVRPWTELADRVADGAPRDTGRAVSTTD